MTGSSQPFLVTDQEGLRGAVARAQTAAYVSLDTEANGLFAYRARACVVQLAWRESAGVVVALIDPLTTSLAPLTELLGPAGPPKILHDLTFDARLLGEADLPLANVRDTEVAARLLGRQALGLAALLASELGLAMKKGLQRHDWSRRPFTEAQLLYLAADVEHLEALWSALDRAVVEKDLAPEVEEETAYKLASAGAPETARTAWIRIVGARDLDGPGRAVLRRLVERRESLAKARDVPPFHVIASERLLALARARPESGAALASVLRAGPRDAELGETWMEAIRQGLTDGDAPEAELAELRPPPPPRPLLQRRQRLERALGAWRKREAAARGWGEQAVLPGHCARDLAAALASAEGDDAAARAIRAVPAIGARRVGWFEATWLTLARETQAEEP